MITIVVLGIDPYNLLEVSKDLTNALAQICEVEENDINFYAPEGLMIHNGHEQNMWNVLVKVTLPKKLQILQKDIAKVISSFISNFVIHSEIIFSYYSQDDREVFINRSYPLFIEDKNVLEVEEPNEKSEVYEGDMFENFEEKINKQKGCN